MMENFINSVKKFFKNFKSNMVKIICTITGFSVETQSFYLTVQLFAGMGGEDWLIYGILGAAFDILKIGAGVAFIHYWRKGSIVYAILLLIFVLFCTGVSITASTANSMNKSNEIRNEVIVKTDSSKDFNKVKNDRIEKCFTTLSDKQSELEVFNSSIDQQVNNSVSKLEIDLESARAKGLITGTYRRSVEVITKEIKVAKANKRAELDVELNELKLAVLKSEKMLDYAKAMKEESSSSVGTTKGFVSFYSWVHNSFVGKALGSKSPEDVEGWISIIISITAEMAGGILLGIGFSKENYNKFIGMTKHAIKKERAFQKQSNLIKKEKLKVVMSNMKTNITKSNHQYRTQVVARSNKSNPIGFGKAPMAIAKLEKNTNYSNFTQEQLEAYKESMYNSAVDNKSKGFKAIANDAGLTQKVASSIRDYLLSTGEISCDGASCPTYIVDNKSNQYRVN